MRSFSKPLVGSVSVLVISAFLLTGCGAAEEPTTATEEVAVESAAETEVAADEEVEPVTEEVVAEEPAGATFADGILALDDRTITITDARVIPVGEAGNEYGSAPVVAFWYEVTNVSGEDMDPLTSWIFAFSAFQDNDPNMINELNVASSPDSQYLDTQSASIKPGGTLANAVAYELSDETTPVELVASDDLGFSEVGRMTFTLD